MNEKFKNKLHGIEGIDFSDHELMVDQGYLSKVISPCGKLVLFNYTKKCTFEKKWNKTTLKSRGSVYELDTGKIVANAFPKIFNFEELERVIQERILIENNFEAFEKIDGSLGIIYHYDGEWRVNTRGSFTSKQAIKAKELLSNYNMDYVNPGLTLLVEIVYPENKVIVDYGDREELILLGAVSKSGIEMTYGSLHSVSMVTGMEMAKRFKFDSIYDIIEEQNHLDTNHEGFIVRFKSGYRCKFKSKEYLKLAKKLSDLTPLNIWNNMKMGIIDDSFLMSIPEEFRNELDKICLKLKENYSLKEKEINDDFKYVTDSIGDLSNSDEDRRKLGLWLMENEDTLDHPNAMFAKLSQKPDLIDGYIKKAIKPKRNVL